jgi:predicted TIM-barrel fold metal-dependent hydrolase
VIVDAHAHLEAPIYGVTPDPQRKRMTKLLMWSFEVMGFQNPLWRGEPPGPARIVIAMENQIRLSMGCRENLVRYMDKNGIDKSVVLPVAPFSTSTEYLQACEGEPRLTPFAGAYPSDNWEDELQRAMEGGCKGLKIHPILQRIAPEDPFYFDLLEAYQHYGRPVIAHTGEFDYYIVKDGFSPFGDVRRLEKLIAAFPSIPFILGHMGLYYSERAIELARRYEHVYLETSFQSLKVVRRALEAVGRERVFFGSDWPESDSRYALRIARKAAGEDRELCEKLTGGNILALLS